MATDMPDFNSTLGADFCGFAASCAVFGILTAQTYTYFKHYPADKLAYKLLVITLLFLELIDQTFIAHQLYWYCITLYGQPLVMLGNGPVWSLISQVEIGALCGTIVKACFAMRVWRFSGRNAIITGVILLLTFSQMATATAFTVRCFRLTTLESLVDEKGLGTLSLGLGVATDVVTAGALCFFLRHLRTGHSKSDSLVNNLMLYAVNTGALTSAVSLTTLILFNVMPSNFIFMGFYFVVSKLYVISFLATLNTRRIVRGKGTDSSRTEGASFHMVTRTNNGAEGGASKKYPVEGIYVDREQTTITDYDAKAASESVDHHAITSSSWSIEPETKSGSEAAPHYATAW